jgi:hypothetical protein
MKRPLLLYLNLALWADVYIRITDSLSLASATLFWASAILFLIEAYRRTGYRALRLSVAGTALNAIASLANGGRMPVLNYHVNAGPFWQPMPGNVRLYWLCDIFPHWCSLGDFVLVAALAAALLEMFVRRRSNEESNEGHSRPHVVLQPEL